MYPKSMLALKTITKNMCIINYYKTPYCGDCPISDYMSDTAPGLATDGTGSVCQSQSECCSP